MTNHVVNSSTFICNGTTHRVSLQLDLMSNNTRWLGPYYINIGSVKVLFWKDCYDYWDNICSIFITYQLSWICRYQTQDNQFTLYLELRKVNCVQLCNGYNSIIKWVQSVDTCPTLFIISCRSKIHAPF